MDDMKDMLKVYTINEVEEMLTVTRRTLYSYIKDGKLKAVKIGREWRVKHSDLQAFLDRGTL
jgi:excisionase family DNA binding protein